MDGSGIIQVHVDKVQQQDSVENKVEIFSGVDKKLTGKDVTSEFQSFNFNKMTK